MKKLIHTFVAAIAAVLSTAAFGAWTFDETNNTLSNEDWSFAGVTLGTVNGVSGLVIVGAPTQKGSNTVIDFTNVQADTNYKVVKHSGDGNLRMCTEYIGPDVTDLGNMFYGASDKAPNNNLVSVTVSPDITSIGTFKRCKTLEIVKTTATVGDTVVFPKLTYVAKELFREDSALAGSYEFPVATALAGKMFMGTQVRELRFPVLTTFTSNYDYMFNGCTKLVTCYMPNVTTIAKVGSTWAGCSELTTLTIAANVDFPEGIGQATFSGCSKLTSFPNLTFPTATVVESSAFSGCGITGKLSVPQATSIGDSAFNGCKLSEIYAPKAATIGSSSGNTFRDCANLEKLTLGSICSTDGKTPKKGIMTLKSTGSDIYLMGNTAPTAFNDGYWMQPSTAALKTMNARVWMKTGTDSMWEAWKTQFSGTSGFVEAKDFDANYTGATYYPGADVTLGCFNNLNGGYAWICEWGTYDAVVNCPAGVQVAAFRADGETVAPAEDGTYKILKTATVEIDYGTTGDYLFADGSSTASATGLAAAATYAASVCPKSAVACEAKIGSTLYLTLQEAFTAGGSVILLKDVASAAALTVASDKTVVLPLGGFTISASGTVFDVAGSLTISGEGIVHGTAFAGSGTIRLAGGTYDFDVNAYCVPGFLAEVQGTDPETWKVVQNTNVTYLNVAQNDLAGAYVAAIGLDFAGVYTCVTNDGTISFELPKDSPFSVVFTAENGYRFEGSDKTRTKAYETGIASTTTLTALDIPVATACPDWTFDTNTPSQGYLVCGDIRLKVTTTQIGKTSEYLYTVTKTSEAGDSYTGFEVSGVETLGEATEIDFAAVADGAGYDVISIASSVLSYTSHQTELASLVSVKAPHVVYLAYGAFCGKEVSKNVFYSPLQSVTLSPNLYYVGGRAFMGTSGLSALEPHAFMKCETFDVANRYNFKYSSVKGDYTFGRLKVVPENCFEACTNLTNILLPSCERVLSGAISGCSSLTNFYGPKVVDIRDSALNNCTRLTTVDFSTAITNLGSQAFYQDTSLVSLPEANWTNLLYLGGSNFESSKFALGDVKVPSLTALGGRSFNSSKLTSCYAPNVRTMGVYIFKDCPQITNLTICGSAECFKGDNVFQSVTTLRSINWLGDEAPTKLYQYSLFGGTSQRPAVVHVVSGKDIAGWQNICTTTKAEMDASDNLVGYKLLAKQCGLKWNSRIVGFIGTVGTPQKGNVVYASAVNSNCCWVRDDGPRGFTVIIR